MMNQNSQKNPKSKQLTWDDVADFPPHKKINALTNAYPKEYQFAALKLIENAGLESHDLLYWQLVMDIHRANSTSKTFHNTTEILKDRPALLAKISTLEKKVDENQKLLLKKIGCVKLNVDLNLENMNTLLKGVTNTSKKRKEKTQKEIWWEWIQTPTGSMLSVIAVLLLMILIFK